MNDKDEVAGRTLSGHGGVGGRVPDMRGGRGVTVPHRGVDPNGRPVPPRPEDPTLARLALGVCWGIIKYFAFAYGMMLVMLLVGMMFMIVFGLVPA